jgi:type I restriction enzyme R subunit
MPRMLGSNTLRAQAAANTKEQFANSPSLLDEFIGAAMEALAAHEAMSKQALGSPKVQAGILAAMLGPGGPWEALRAAGQHPGADP